MSHDEIFEIKRDEKFNDGRPLSNAPVIEAVIHWRARSESPLVPDEFLERLKEKLPDYPIQIPQHELEMEFTAGSEGASHSQRASWRGFRFESEDKLHVAQFNRNGFAFSRLKQYEQWNQFTGEALRLWKIYVELAKPIEIERLGIRFINVIEIKKLDEMENWFSHFPKSPQKMRIPIQNFMHQTKYNIPEHPYNLNVVQTVQPNGHSQTNGLRLILDLDVSTSGPPVQPDDLELSNTLEDMRWIKNKAFEAHLTPEAIKSFE